MSSAGISHRCCPGIPPRLPPGISNEGRSGVPLGVSPGISQKLPPRIFFNFTELLGVLSKDFCWRFSREFLWEIPGAITGTSWWTPRIILGRTIGKELLQEFLTVFQPKAILEFLLVFRWNLFKSVFWYLIQNTSQGYPRIFAPGFFSEFCWNFS